MTAATSAARPATGGVTVRAWPATSRVSRARGAPVEI
jgi:hypothetical protein